MSQLTQCIRLDLDCADACTATARIASRRTGSNALLVEHMLRICAEACHVCAEECERHAKMHDHCRICAETCRSCEAACGEALGSIQ